MNAVTKRRLIQQGFSGIDDEILAEAGPWLRLAPGLCTLITVTGTGLGSWPMLWALAAAGIAAAVTRKHPFDRIYDALIRKLLGRDDELPLYRTPRRFSAALTAGWLLATGLMFLLGWSIAGRVLGLTLGAALLLAATTDICLGCIILEQLQAALAPRRVLKQRPRLREAMGLPETTAPRISALRPALPGRPSRHRTAPARQDTTAPRIQALRPFRPTRPSRS